MSLFAEINNGIVSRVIVAESVEWCQSRLGGTWIETRDDDTQENYAGPGMGYDPNAVAKFAMPWVQPIPGETEGYRAGHWVWHVDRLWQAVAGNNVWEPGQYGWRDHTEGNIPTWVQPAGAGDVFRLNDVVAHNGKIWRSNNDANVWKPGGEGIGSSIWEDITEPPLAEEFPAWQPWTSGLNSDLYQIGDQVSHNGKNWVATVGNNNWEPGVFGWDEIT